MNVNDPLPSSLPSVGFLFRIYCLKSNVWVSRLGSEHPSTMHRHPQFKPFHYLRPFMQNKQRSHRALTEVLTVCYRLTASVNIRGEAKTFSESQGTRLKDWKDSAHSCVNEGLEKQTDRESTGLLDYWLMCWGCLLTSSSILWSGCSLRLTLLVKPAAPGFARHMYSLIYGKFTHSPETSLTSPWFNAV